MTFFKYILFSSILVLAACNGSDSSNSQNNSKNSGHYVNWESVTPDFNPSINTISFQTNGVEKINLDAFGFENDVRVIYSPDLQPTEGLLKIYKVWRKQATFGSMSPVQDGKILKLYNYGEYVCSIRVQNGRITDLEGGCYVRVELTLPVGAEIEVYNVKRLITKRFISISTEEFLKSVRSATWPKDKFAVISDYLSSYTATRKPSLTSRQLGDVIQEFMMTDDKLAVLDRLHTIVSDRNNLTFMIEDKFTYFDREKARRIVGMQ